MNALLILIPITLVLATVAVGEFFWAVNHAQFEDLDTRKSCRCWTMRRSTIATTRADAIVRATASMRERPALMQVRNTVAVAP